MDCEPAHTQYPQHITLLPLAGLTPQAIPSEAFDLRSRLVSFLKSKLLRASVGLAISDHRASSSEAAAAAAAQLAAVDGVGARLVDGLLERLPPGEGRRASAELATLGLGMVLRALHKAGAPVVALPAAPASAAAAASASVSGAESSSCAAALRGALGYFMAHGAAATRSALDGCAADLFGEAISRHPTLAAAALLPDLPAFASGGAKTAFLRSEAFRLLAALFKAKDKDKDKDKEDKEEQPAKKAKKGKAEGKAKEAALGPMQAAAAPAALAAACSVLEATAAALEAALKAPSGCGSDKDGEKDEGVGKPRRLLPVMELAATVAATHPAALAVTATKSSATLGARLGAAAAAVGGRSMAQAVQQGARRVLAALEANGLAAPAMEMPQHKHTQLKHEGKESETGEAKAAKKKRSRDAVATTREAAIAAVAARRAAAGSTAGGEAVKKKPKILSQTEGQGRGPQEEKPGKTAKKGQ